MMTIITFIYSQEACIEKINDLRVPLDGASCAHEVWYAGKFQSQNAESIKLLLKDQSFHPSRSVNGVVSPRPWLTVLVPSCTG